MYRTREPNKQKVIYNNSKRLWTILVIFILPIYASIEYAKVGNR